MRQTREQIIVKSFIEYLEMQVCKNELITVNKAARTIFVSTIYLRQCCKKVLGLSPKIIINKRTVEKSIYLFHNLSICENVISEKMGFADESSFCHFFKRQTGRLLKDYIS